MLRKLVITLLSGALCLLVVTAALAVKYNEAPMLRTMVAAGELPPVEERLPEEPVIVQPVEEIGQYGGMAHLFTLSAHELDGDGMVLIGVEQPLRVDTDAHTIAPNIIRKWDSSKDAKTLTIYLRKGIKWSDGVPFTADDIMFWYEDMFLNDEITPVKPMVYCPGGEPMRLKKLDDYTIRFDFATPYPKMWKYLLSSTWGAYLLMPKHYLKKFHIDYNPEADKIAKEQDFDSWYQLFESKRDVLWGGIPQSPDYPGLTSFICVKNTPEYALMERNPFYWKVDPEGNQLPYIDKLLVSRLSDVEVYNAKVTSGEADFAGSITTMDNYVLYKQGEEKGNYRVLRWKTCITSILDFELNLSVEDPVLRKIFRDVRFRQALSLAMNREEINEALFFGLAEPRQFTVLSTSSYYEEKNAKAYAQYDPEEANRLLDEMGLKWDENHEYRLRPDGKRLNWIYDGTKYVVDMAKGLPELVREQWRDIGVDVTVRIAGFDLQQAREQAGKIQMGGWQWGGGLDAGFPGQGYMVSLNFPTVSATWWSGWWEWFSTNGKEGEEPLPWVKRLNELGNKMEICLDEEELVRLGKEMCEIQAENLFHIGTVALTPKPILVKNNLRNVPQEAKWSSAYRYTSYCHPEQFFFKQK